MSDQTPENPTPPQSTPPQPPYGAPAAPPAYTAPAAAPYGAPAPPYGAPAPQYGAPAQPYGAQAPAYGYAPVPRTNSLAIVSLVASLVGVFVIPVIGQLVGIITGHISLGQLKSSGERGRGMALAGTIIGYVSLGLAILGIILFFAVFLPFAITNGARYGIDS